MFINERYTDFLKFALFRVIEIATFYEKEAKQCKDQGNRLFLYYLAGKKRVQHVILEMIATSNRRGKPLELPEYNTLNFSETISSDTNLWRRTPEEILAFGLGRAQKDFNLFVSLAALEEDPQTKKLLNTLARLAKEYLADITAGYTHFTLKKSGSLSLTVNAVPERIREKACSDR